MFYFWETVVQPALDATMPRTVVEIGAEAGHLTDRLVGWCQARGAILHAIDPKPAFDVPAWEARCGDNFVMHVAMSLDALPTIADIDAVLIDGDHNWYTVHEELRLIETGCTSRGRSFPLVLVHDIGWPYGRRDLYYDPETIPAASRQPYGRGAMLPEGRSWCKGEQASMPVSTTLRARERPATACLRRWKTSSRKRHCTSRLSKSPASTA